MSARRWVCPKCSDGCLAPSRPRRDDVRKFCLPCSKATGRLVERICPAADNAKARELAAHRAKREANRAATQARQAVERQQRATAHAAKRALREQPIGELAKLQGRVALEEAARRYAKLKAWGKDLSDAEAAIRISADSKLSSGHAYGHAHRFVVTAGTDIADAHATIIHELAHLATRKCDGHGADWRLLFRAAISEVVGREVLLSGDLDRLDFHNALTHELALFLYGGAQ